MDLYTPRGQAPAHSLGRKDHPSYHEGSYVNGEQGSLGHYPDNALRALDQGVV